MSKQRKQPNGGFEVTTKAVVFYSRKNVWQIGGLPHAHKNDLITGVQEKYRRDSPKSPQHRQYQSRSEPRRC